jgi:hypothetical protein
MKLLTLRQDMKPFASESRTPLKTSTGATAHKEEMDGDRETDVVRMVCSMRRSAGEARYSTSVSVSGLFLFLDVRGGVFEDL